MNLKPPKARYLIDEVVDRLVPLLEQHGFLWQEVYRNDPEQTVFAFGICLKRAESPKHESINIQFDKNGKPRVTCDLHRLDQAGGWRRADVVRYQTDYYRAKQFGIFWRSIDRRFSRLAKDVDQLISIVPQMIAYIDHGEVGPNIRKWPETATPNDTTNVR